MRSSLGKYLWLVVLGVFAAGASGARGQALVSDATEGIKLPLPNLRFDAVSIREAHGETMSTINSDPASGLFFAQSLSIWGLIVTAYDIKIGALVVGLPKWAGGPQYDIQATSDPATNKALAKLPVDVFRAEKREMLQAMLAERFHLRVHFENRMSTTYALVATAAAAKRMVPVTGAHDKTILSCYPEISAEGFEIRSAGCAVPTLVFELQQGLGTYIADETAMPGLYAYHLAYTSQLSTDAGKEHFPYVADALREQMGLELKRTRAPVPFLVVDHVAPPTPN